MSYAKIWIDTNNGLKIWDKFGNLDHFCDTTGLTEASASVVNKQATVKGSSVHYYMNSEATYTRAATVKDFIYDPGRRKGNAIPGKPFVLVSDAGLPGEETRQFTYEGAFTDLHAFVVGSAKMLVDLFSETGTRYTSIPGTTP